jgi:formylglycine-generating enzyme required for sulfatase activity
VPDRTTPGAREATVYLVDVYAGEGLAGVPRGTVKQLRLFTYHFNYFGTSALGDPIGADGPWDVRRVLGTVPVDADGSAYFTVPANTPIALQPLDADGQALQLMRSWFTGMPGEQVSCVGCHEREWTTPPVQPLYALRRRPSPITPWHGPARGFSWSREVQPVLDRYCVGCHDGTARADVETLIDLRGGEPVPFTANGQPSAAQFPLSFWHLRRYVRSPGLEGQPQVTVADYHADSNLLVQLLRSGHHGVRLDADSWSRLVTWMDLNAPAYGTWLEMPTIGDRRSTIEQCVARRKECRQLYGGIVDDPETVAAPPPENLKPIVPPAPPPVVPVRVDGWPLGADVAARLQAAAGPRREWRVELGDSMQLVLVLAPAGEFVMGDADGADNERSLRRVTIERPFWLGKFEVTNAQFRRFDPTHQSGTEPILGLKWSPADFHDLSHSDKPVCRVSWDRANAFCRWLSQRMGREFSLPTEEQWEWAGRAGTDTPWSFGRSDDAKRHANLADQSLLALFNSELMPPFLLIDEGANDGQVVAAPVGTYRPNAWGLHDMHGNVAEWTASLDTSDPSVRGGPPDAKPDRRVVRGGSWSDPARFARSARRISFHSWQGVYNVGFRVACPAK